MQVVAVAVPVVTVPVSMVLIAVEAATSPL